MRGNLEWDFIKIENCYSSKNSWAAIRVARRDIFFSKIHRLSSAKSRVASNCMGCDMFFQIPETFWSQVASYYTDRDRFFQNSRDFLVPSREPRPIFLKFQRHSGPKSLAASYCTGRHLFSQNSRDFLV